jgi:hypothetical protein
VKLGESSSLQIPKMLSSYQFVGTTFRAPK